MSLGQRMINHIGQLRLYSLIDLTLLLFAFGASATQAIGAMSLWIGFLGYLEWRHEHANRARVPVIFWIACFCIGLYFVPTIYSAIFIALCVIYAEKISRAFGAISPIMRGLQTCILLVAVTGALSSHILIAAIAIGIRNLLGDLRDIQKDSHHGLKTIPVLLGFTRDIRYVHLFGVLSTTLLWWSWTTLPLSILIVVWAIEIGTYNLTPR